MEPLHLTINPWCPRCVVARAWLLQRGCASAGPDASADRDAWRDTGRLSGRTRAPTAVVGEHVLADFGPDELEAFLQRIGYGPDERV